MNPLPSIFIAMAVMTPQESPGGPGGGRGGPDAPNAPQIDPVVEDAFEAWGSREESLRAFDLEFRVERTSQSRSFGVPGVAAETKKTPPVRLRVASARLRFDGEGRPPIEVGGEPVGLAPLFEKGEGDDSEYLTALWSGFERPTTPKPAQPYILIRDPQTVTHYWERQGEQYPRSLILASDALRERTPLERWQAETPAIVDALLMALRPSVAIDAPRRERFTLLSEQSLLDGVTCVLMEETLQERSPNRVRRYWLDPARGLVPLRVLLLEDGVSSTHWEFDYDELPNKAWVPSRWSVLRLHPFGGVDEFTTVARTAWRSTIESPSETFAVDFTPGTWVVDLERGRQSLVEAGGGMRRLGFSETAGEATYASLLAKGDRRSIWPTILRTLGTLVTWPWALLTLPLLWVVVQSTGTVVRKRRAAHTGGPRPSGANLRRARS